MKKINSLRIFSLIVILYMVMALTWWTYLLYNKNLENHQLQTQLFPQNTEQLQEKFERQKTMILGEGLVFGLALIAGIWFINNAYVRQVKTTQKQNNFLLSITHELKSPLASIKLIIQTLLKRELPADKAKMLNNNALSEVSRLESMVNNLLFATKIDHHYQYNFEQTEISAILNQRLNLFANKFPERRLKINANSKIEAKVDKEGLISIIDNLLDNCNKYAPSDQEIEITLKKKDNQVEFIIADQGNGIPNSEKKKVLEKFYRIGDENTRASSGSGLGLYIVSQIIHEHSGTFKILDNQPKGTKFLVSIPI